MSACVHINLNYGFISIIIIDAMIEFDKCYHVWEFMRIGHLTADHQRHIRYRTIQHFLQHWFLIHSNGCPSFLIFGLFILATFCLSMQFGINILSHRINSNYNLLRWLTRVGAGVVVVVTVTGTGQQTI